MTLQDQEHHQSEEEDGDVSEKSYSTDRDQRSPGTMDRSKFSLLQIHCNRRFSCNSLRQVNLLMFRDYVPPPPSSSLSSFSSSPVSRPRTDTSSGGETEQKKVRTKLMKFLLKRPTLQFVKEKGYIRGGLIGSSFLQCYTCRTCSKSGYITFTVRICHDYVTYPERLRFE